MNVPLSRLRQDALHGVRLARLGCSGDVMSTTIAIPRRRKGRPWPKAEAHYLTTLRDFAHTLSEIASRLDDKVSARGWCYILENEGRLSKGDFDQAEAAINECRREGLLPVDFTASDESRSFDCVQYVGDLPEEEAAYEVKRLVASTIDYSPTSFWEDQDYYLQMLVEKIDLKILFKRICSRYYLPIANAKGWSDLNQRHEMMKRFQYWEARGKKCVLLYCGDFDPIGMQISESLMKNMEDLKKAAHWSPENVVIDRFGLNPDFIGKHRLTWIEGLMTSGGKDLADPKHAFYNCAYIQEWLKTYGARKVEANALVVRPDAGRTLCLKAITKYVQPAAPAEFEARIEPFRQELLNQTLTRLMDSRSVETIRKEMSRDD